MESLSRPPQRRKHSSASNVFSTTTSSLKSPYDDVLLSKVAASRKIPFKAQEYAEIFSGSSSIPVLDLPGLDKRVGSGHTRQLDYSNIFGGLSNDMAVPYEELLNGSVKRTNQRLPENARAPSREADPVHSSEKTKKFSEEGSDQSADELKQRQFSISFNRTSQPNIDTSSGKTYVAQCHAVPGFTSFVDGTPQPEKTKEHYKPVSSSLKREVSRTWSFSAELEAVKGKGVPSNWDNGINLTPQSSKVQLPSARGTNLRFVSKKDVSGKIAGDHSPPLLDEELDENSVAGLSAAALKKALDQAEKTIRITKLIMEGKREGFHDGKRSKPKGYSKLKEKKKNKVHHNFSCGGSEEKIVDVANKLGEASVGVHKQFTESSSSQSENIYNSEKASLEEEKVEVCKEVTDVSGLVASAERKAANIVSGLVGNIKNLMLSRNKQSPEEMDTSKKAEEPVEVTFHHMEGHEAITELPEMFSANPNGVQELEKNPTETSERCQATVDCLTEPENFNELVEEVCSPSRVTVEQVKIEDGKNHEKGVIEDVEESSYHEETRDGKFQETEEMVVSSEFKSTLNGSQNLVRQDVQDGEEIKEKSENVKEDGHEQRKNSNEEDNLKKQTDDHLLNADIREILNENKPKVCPEIDERRTKVYLTCDAETDDEKRNSSDAEVEHIEGTEMNSFSNVAAQTIEVEPKIHAEVQGNEYIHNAGEIYDSPLSSQDSSYEKSVEEAVDGSDVSKGFSGTPEAHDLDLNDIVEGYKRAFESNEETGGGLSVSKTISGLGKDIQMPETDRLRKCFSEELIAGNKSHNAEKLSSDGEKSEDDSFDEEKEKFGVNDANYEENLPKEQDADETTREICDDTEGITRIDWQNLSDFHPSDGEPAEFGHADVEKVVEQTLENDEESVSTSRTESISQDWAENENDNTLNNDGQKDDFEMNFNERSCVEQQMEAMQSHLCHDNMGKSMETESDTKTDQTMEKNKENLSETPTTMKERENVQKFDKDNEHQERIEAIKRGREREKDRKVVERAIREARERAFAEARERAERAAVERAAAEARQRAMAEAKEKASLAAKQPLSDKASMEAKIRAERAAVERATAEARGRALEKARSQNTFTESSSSRNIGLKHSFSSSDLEKSDGANSESAQRRKARLERHQRIMERAAKALEEKNMRDLIVQKEQAERNRLAESLDADIKRWAAGKEGNLRALLSTLQYVLGPDSGWQAISLTEMIATTAVKKVYRKATLYVHPDKLQQRGASIRQKYICEKVFDLLKAAWNRFNSEER